MNGNQAEQNGEKKMKELEYKLLGVEEFSCICDFCNKKQLTKSYVVESINGDIKRFGSSCIKKALKITQSDVSNLQYAAAKRLEQKILNNFPALNWKMTNQIMKQCQKYFGIN